MNPREERGLELTDAAKISRSVRGGSRHPKPAGLLCHDLSVLCHVKHRLVTEPDLCA
jgi:hypothetical protein